MSNDPGTTPADTSERDAPLYDLISNGRIGTLATIKRDGRPQLSNVSFTYDAATKTIRVSVTDTRAKVANIRRDPRVSLVAQGSDGWSFAVAEGTGELTPVTIEPDDETANELVEVYRAIGGEHPDWDEYRAAMIRDQRLVLRIPIERVYGLVR